MPAAGPDLCRALLPVSLLPTVAGRILDALLLGSAIVWLSWRFALTRSEPVARALFIGSIVYLPLIWAAMISITDAVPLPSRISRHNAALNGLSGPWRSDRAHPAGVRPHRRCMIAAFVISSLFLASYLTYHAQVGSVRFTVGVWYGLYLRILITHVSWPRPCCRWRSSRYRAVWTGVS